MSDVLVLCYHAVSPRWPADLSVTPEAFERQLQLLVGRGYRGATFTTPSPRRPTAPRWRSRSTTRTCRCSTSPSRSWTGSAWSGTVFVPTDYPEREGPMAWPGIDQWLGGEHEAELRPMTWPQMRGLAEARLGDRLAHLLAPAPHRARRGHARPRDDPLPQVMRAEPGTPCMTIAYPYGDYDVRVAAAAGRAGYQAACTLPARFTRRSRWSGRAWACTTATTTAAR